MYICVCFLLKLVSQFVNMLKIWLTCILYMKLEQNESRSAAIVYPCWTTPKPPFTMTRFEVKLLHKNGHVWSTIWSRFFLNHQTITFLWQLPPHLFYFFYSTSTIVATPHKICGDWMDSLKSRFTA